MLKTLMPCGFMCWDDLGARWRSCQHALPMKPQCTHPKCLLRACRPYAFLVHVCITTQHGTPCSCRSLPREACVRHRAKASRRVAVVYSISSVSRLDWRLVLGRWGMS